MSDPRLGGDTVGPLPDGGGAVTLLRGGAVTLLRGCAVTLLGGGAVTLLGVGGRGDTGPRLKDGGGGNVDPLFGGGGGGPPRFGGGGGGGPVARG